MASAALACSFSKEPHGASAVPPGRMDRSGCGETLPVDRHALERTSTDLLLLADTHLGAGQADRLFERIEQQLDDVDVVVHAGDITDATVLDALARRVPAAELLVVKGNNDRGLDLPDRLVAEVGGCVIGIVHDSGPAAGRGRRLRRWFPSCDLVVFGHSHLPWHEVEVAPDGHVQHQVNPGSAMLRRRAPTCTIARVVLRGGEVADAHHVAVDGSRPRP
jgi:putative phosphoesterase